MKTYNKGMINKFSNLIKETDRIYLTKEIDGYWSNLSKEQNSKLMSMLGTVSTKQCIEETTPIFTQVIFSEKRVASLELLQLDGSETVVDLGCMWGALSIPLAKQASYVLGVDQTLESLKFTEARADEENLENIDFICGNLRELDLPKDSFDVAVVNGVLEWIPEIEPIVVNEFVHKNKKRDAEGNPGKMQYDFLRNIYSGLKPNGRIFLAIENRYDYKMFFGQKDPHTGTYLTTITPRWLANIISILFKRRGYRPWIYSFKEIEYLLNNAGFNKVKLYACWPDYRFPEHINVYGESNQYFRPVSVRNMEGNRSIKRIIANRIEWLIFKKLNLQFFAPSIIAIAAK
jgi:2-polyprenyl-3-methyl-5-hydroxy-6-metoxy-1,4-benzoquinol methylase